jgi:hypothetical protein
VIDLRENDRSPLPNVTIDGAGGVVVDEAKVIDEKPE